MKNNNSNARHERNSAVADAVHQHHREALQNLVGSVIGFGTEALKAAALVNGGSAAATLAFISQTIDKKQPLALALVGPIKWFAWGLLLSVIATGVAYVAQMCIATSWSKDEYSNEHPYIRETRATENWRDTGIVLQVLSIGLVILSYVFALLGFNLAANVLEMAAS